MEFSTPARWLARELDRRRGRNPRYSLRAFARALGLQSGHLSEMLAGKREIGPRIATRLADRLALEGAERDSWIALARTDFERRQEQRKPSLLRRIEPAAADYHEVSDAELKLITEWYHVALLNLLETDDFRPDIAWIARRLGIEPAVAGAAADRLELLGLIKREPRGWSRTRERLTTSRDIPSTVLRAAHRDKLERGIRALEEVDVALRDISSVCLPIARERLPEAKKILEQFRRSFAQLFEQGPKTDVYYLSLAFFPVTRPGGGDA